jgi:hypothetical protein
VPELSKVSLVDLLTHAIFWVTGGHEFLGGLMEYILSPAGLMPRICPEKNVADLDSFFIVATLYGTTGKSMNVINCEGRITPFILYFIMLCSTESPDVDGQLEPHLTAR